MWRFFFCIECQVGGGCPTVSIVRIHHTWAGYQNDLFRTLFRMRVKCNFTIKHDQNDTILEAGWAPMACAFYNRCRVWVRLRHSAEGFTVKVQVASSDRVQGSQSVKRMVSLLTIVLFCNTNLISTRKVYEDVFLTEFMEFGRKTRKVS